MGITADAIALSLGNGADISLDGLSYSVQNADRPWSLEDLGDETLRFELRSGDVWSDDPSTKERTEIAGEAVYAAGKDITVSYEFRVEPGPENTSDWLVIGQLHATDEFSTPIFAVEMIGEKLAIHLRYKLPGEQYQDWFAYIDDKPIVRGQYYSLDVELHMHDDKYGSADVWIDGRHVVDYSGYVGYGYGVYWKHGIYRAAASETIVVDYRDLQITGEVGVLIKGSAGDDVITPSTRCPGNPMQTTEGDIIYGGGGDDYIRGSRGHDILFGEQGADVLIGGRKGDTLIGGPGDDRLRGGLGKDVFRFEERSGDDVIGRFRVGTDLIALDHHLFKSAADALSHFDQTKKGAVLSLGHDTVLFKGTTVEQFSDHDLLFV